MSKKKWLMLLIITAWAGAGSANESQSVNELFLKYKLDDHWSVFSRSRAQFGKDMSTFNFALADAGLAYKLHPHWSLGAGYRKLWAKPAATWKTESRPLVELAWFDTCADISLRNRSRFEYRHFDFNKDDDLRYRNQSRAEFPWDLCGIKPYLEEEFFISHNSGKWDQNWLTGGLYFKPADAIKIRLAYRLVSLRKKTDWVNVDQLYFAMGLSF